MSGPNQGKSVIDTSVPHPARRYNYWLGGKDNFAADRESADEIERKFPGMRTGVVANRAFLRRVIPYLTQEAGIRQFLDIGTGLPTADNTHEVAQRIAPESRILYVDNDPLVMTHARALLTSSPEGRTDYLEADLRNPGSILGDPMLRDTLDLSQPVALMLVAILHFVPGEGKAQPLVEQLLDRLPSGSYMAATHFTLDFMPPEEKERYEQMLAGGRSDVWPRSHAEFGALFNGLELVEPGIGLVSQWRPEPGTEQPEPRLVSMLAAVGRKP
ncbi:MAG TPA: SAM-dependent methyltransferase [Actinoplanes sp.]|nr:SAM-dependent methyltransferase [Actinoplanes sp.]